MTQQTTPDGITLWTTEDPASLAIASQAQGASVQNALNKRQRYDYIWPTASERNAQTGMVQSSRGYQLDTKSEYIYDNSQWRLALPYAEYSTASQSVPNASYTIPSTFTINSSVSTSTTFTAPGGSGTISLTDPGVYALSWVIKMGGGNYTGGFCIVTTDSAMTDFVAISPFTAGVSGVTIPFYRTSSSNSILYFRMYQASGASVNNVTSTLRIGRLG